MPLAMLKGWIDDKLVGEFPAQFFNWPLLLLGGASPIIFISDLFQARKIYRVDKRELCYPSVLIIRKTSWT